MKLFLSALYDLNPKKPDVKLHFHLPKNLLNPRQQALAWRVCRRAFKEYLSLDFDWTIVTMVLCLLWH